MTREQLEKEIQNIKKEHAEDEGIYDIFAKYGVSWIHYFRSVAFFPQCDLIDPWSF